MFTQGNTKRPESPYLAKEIKKKNLKFVMEEVSAVDDSSSRQSVQENENEIKVHLSPQEKLRRMQTSEQHLNVNNTKFSSFILPVPKAPGVAGGILKQPPTLVQTKSAQQVNQIKRRGTVKSIVSRAPISSAENGANIDSEIYHQRRKQTSYLVGFDDLEPPLAEIIKINSTDVAKLQLETKQLSKEFADNKRYIEIAQS